MPTKKSAKWRDVINPPANQWLTGGMIRPVEDPMNREDNLKDIGYPVGLHSMRRADVWLNNIKSGANVTIASYPPGVTPVGPLQIQPHGEMRGLYLDFIDISSIIPQNFNIQVEWQIWSDGHRVANGVHTSSSQPMNLWFPPFSNESFYLRVTNLAAVPPTNINVAVAVHYVVFDVNGFEWQIGKGSGTQNPPFVNVTWPGFA